MRQPIRCLIFLLAAGLTLCSTQAIAQEPPEDAIEDHVRIPGGYLTIYFDNDLFGGTDENYTNGVRASWISRSRTIDDLSTIYRLLDDFSKFTRIRRETDWFYNYGVSLTQLMYTPEDISTYDFQPDDRAYAGWLGLGFSLHAKNDMELHSLELSLGVVGPESLAESAQDFIHDVRDIPKANGWDHQLKTEPTINLHYRRSRRMPLGYDHESGFGFDSFYRWGADLGTLAVNANGGVFCRFGYNLPVDFSDPKLSLTAYTHQMFREDQEKRVHRRLSVFTTLSAEAKAVVHDIFLDGGTFRDGPSVDKNPVVADFTAAVGVRYRRFQIAYAHTLRTEEFSEQDGAQVFGSLTASYEF